MMISNRAYKKIKLKQQNNNYTSICFTNNIFIEKPLKRTMFAKKIPLKINDF